MTNREIMLKNYSEPEFKKELNGSNVVSEEYKSRSCNDDVVLFFNIDKTIIKEMTFMGEGCAVSTSNANLICKIFTNKNIQECKVIADEYLKMINNETFDRTIMGELLIFEDIRNQRSRKKCATLTMNTFINFITKFY
ncbi:nitrogen fixation protein NifU [Spiroplasma sp. TIUS-1]|uniref:iron-sulfur cluster assembly scaffold protein n=1 Tax=Spiroplasma sp. TIUS-1 TaxID=216963 RepID=UPI0013987DD0|nr:iron-sulfur cluster assembly scaffold protein [Spiroplasma sp. TIUS-1]QHX35799.1 nitrogen fixation protein NifU [Spiroplasma sp. TIUS-1]